LPSARLHAAAATLLSVCQFQPCSITTNGEKLAIVVSKINDDDDNDDDDKHAKICALITQEHDKILQNVTPP